MLPASRPAGEPPGPPSARFGYLAREEDRRRGQLPTAPKRQACFRFASERMCLSGVRSATSRFGRTFSSGAGGAAHSPPGGVLLLPGVGGRFAHPPAGGTHRRPGCRSLRLAEDTGHLLLGECRMLHWPPSQTAWSAEAPSLLSSCRVAVFGEDVTRAASLRFPYLLDRGACALISRRRARSPRGRRGAGIAAVPHLDDRGLPGL